MGQDEAGTVRSLSAARATLDRLITEHGGRVVNSVGDSVLAEFASAVDAVQCAIVAQESLAEADAKATEGPRLLFRIAVHVGDVMPRGMDIFGDGINVCARLQEVAEPGGICISGAAYQYVCKALKVAFDDLGERTLKNIDEPVRVFAVRATKQEQQSPSPLNFQDVQGGRHQAKTRGWIAASGIAAAMGLFVLYQFAMPSATTTAHTGVEAVRAASATPAGAVSVAVLPFTNLSGDASQEFFSDGITEEITTALAKVPDLRVVARTSAFEFKGKNINIRTMGKQLGATHLIEGSVRKAGNRLRITAKLIGADAGVDIWSENYDREFNDIFAIQEDIAQAIAAALRMPLGLRPGERLISNRSIDPESYQEFLRARPLVRARGRGFPQAIELLEPLVQRNPDYAPALALLARAHGYVGNVRGLEKRRRIAEFWPKAEAEARRAIELDPNIVDAYLSLHRMNVAGGKLLASEEFITKALAIDPNSPDALQESMMFLSIVGRRKEALAATQQLLTLEPYVPTFKADAGEILWENGQDDAAIEMLKPVLGIGRVGASLAMIYASQGRYTEAADLLGAFCRH